MIQVIEKTDPLSSIGQAAGTGLSTGLEMLINQKVKDMQKQKLIDMGLSPILLDLPPQIAGPIAKQQMAQQGLEAFLRGGEEVAPGEGVPQQQQQVPPVEGAPSVEGVTPVEGVPPTIVPPTTGLKRHSDEQLVISAGQGGNVGEIAKAELLRRSQIEKVSGRKEESRYKANLPLYQAAQKKLQSAELEDASIKRLMTLNEGGNLPEGIGRWNVSFKDGELLVPFASHPDAQAFVKTINDFTVKAKDSFGARVTNFELERFMKRLPGLLNSEEGRRVILRQMEIITELNVMKDRGIIDVFDAKGGLRNIDYDRATTLAKKQNKPQIEKLRKEYINLNSRKLTEEAQKKKTLKKVAEGTPITKDIVRKLMEKTAGDVKKAKEMGKQLGYEL